MAWYQSREASKLPEMDKSRILVFDTETTGLSVSNNEILQITILDGYGSVLFDSYIKPKHKKHWKSAERINHIGPETVESAPRFEDVKAEIQDLFTRTRLIVGYNVNFDINFIKAAGIIVSGPVFDVMSAFASYHADIDKTIRKNCKLEQCAKYFDFFLMRIMHMRMLRQHYIVLIN